MTIGTSVKTMDTPEALDCRGRGKILRDCNACGAQVNRAADQYVIVSPTWKRCNDLICRACFSTIMTAAGVVIAAGQRGAELYVQDPLGEVGRVLVKLND